MRCYCLCSRLTVLACFSLCVNMASAGELSGADREERRCRDVPLFNGYDLRDWKNDGSWEVEDNAIRCIKDGKNLVYEPLVIKQPYFDLRFDWRTLREASRRKEDFVQPDGSLNAEHRVRHTEWNGNRPEPLTWGQQVYLFTTGNGAVGLFARKPVVSRKAYRAWSFSHCAKAGATKQPGHWNSCRIVWRGTRVQHWLNSTKVLDIRLGVVDDRMPPPLRRATEEWKALSKEALETGLQVQLENLPGPLCYRGLKMQLDPENAGGVRGGVDSASIGSPEAHVTKDRDE